MGHPAAVLLHAAAVVGTGACSPSTARPAFPPFPAAIIDVVAATPDAAIAAVREQFTQDSIEIRRFHQGDGFLETRTVSYDLEGQAADVVFRIWADPRIGQRTRITMEIAYRWTIDPSRIPRDKERHVSRDHPGWLYAQEVLQRVKEAFEP